MKNKKIFGCLMAFAMVATTINMPQNIAKVQAEETCEHVDTNDDNLCDVCNQFLIIDGWSCGEEATYTLNRYTGELVISGNGSVSNNYFASDLSIKTVVIENGITSIGGATFWGCSSLESINIPSSVTSIGDNAFEDCSSLESISIPSSVTSIGEDAFSGCSSLSSINIPLGVESIGEDAFQSCTSLKSISIPSSVTSMGGHAFERCISLETVVISSPSVSKYAFRECSSLKKVILTSNVTSIDIEAFNDCIGLESVTIPSSITSIDACAFLQCDGLKSVTLSGPITNISNLGFYGSNNLSYIFHTGNKENWDPDDMVSLYYGLENANLVTSNCIEGASLALDGTLKVNIKFKSGTAADLTDWTINGEAVTVATNNCATIDVAPNDYNQNIEIKYKGVQVKIFSVADMIYLYEQSEDTKAIAQKLDAYCEAAENYFAGKPVADYESSWETVKSATGNHTITMGDNYYGSSLVLNSGTILRHYYTVDFADKTGTKNSMHYKDEMIPAHQYAMGSASDGTYCVNDYIYRALNNPSSTDDLKNLCVALYNYGVAAKAYSNAVANGGSN